MRIAEIITEDDSYAPVEMQGAESIANFIHDHCSEWLSQTRNGKLVVYRGYSNVKSNIRIFRKKVRSERNPLHSTSLTHASLNFLIKQGGKVANRSNSVFVTGDSRTANTYGEEYVVIPIGKFNYTWHEFYWDWYTDFTIDRVLTKKVDAGKVNTLSKFKAFILKATGIPAAHELYGPVWDVTTDSEDELDTSLVKKWLGGLKGDDGTLAKAIRSNNEIMISCDEVIAIRPDFYTANIVPRLIALLRAKSQKHV